MNHCFGFGFLCYKTGHLSSAASRDEGAVGPTRYRVQDLGCRTTGVQRLDAYGSGEGLRLGPLALSYTLNPTLSLVRIRQGRSG